jgi:hypothetical protein
MSCPECGWDFYEFYMDERYNVNNGNIEIFHPESKEAIYPIYKNYRPIRWGENGYEWIEIHKCPICNEEFEIEDSSA